MSETVIFVIGIVIFAITTYGAVMAGGMALTRAEIEQNPARKEGFSGADRRRRMPFRGKY